MASLPGSNNDIYFGDAEKPLPDWRKEMPEGSEYDDDDAEPTEEETAACIAMLGFDPREFDEGE